MEIRALGPSAAAAAFRPLRLQALRIGGRAFAKNHMHRDLRSP